jgi:hypothetical protein
MANPAKRARTAARPIVPTSEEFKHLEEHGYMVIPGVLTRAECEAAKAGLAEWFTGLGTGLSFTDPTTWEPKNRPAHFHGIVQNLGVAHLQCVWDVRQNERVVNVFQRMWQEDDLLSSFDAICVNPPPKTAPKSKFPFVEGQWYHVDQGRRRGSERQSIQGIATLSDITRRDQTLSVLPGVHRSHAELLRRHQGGDDDWVLFDEPLLRWAWQAAGKKGSPRRGTSRLADPL